MKKADILPSKNECENSLNYVIDTLYVLGGKWKLPLILSLVQSPKRFSELQKDVTGISPKILAKELKHLELNDFIKRNVYDSTPVSIIYEATEYSKSLKKVMKELSAWGFEHRAKIRKALNS